MAKAVVVLALQKPLLSYECPENTGGDAANRSPGGTRGLGEHMTTLHSKTGPTMATVRIGFQDY